jgi:hypothetical protein
MGVPTYTAPISPERANIDQNQKTIARTVLTVVANLTAFNAWLATYTDEVLLAEPYNYSADEVYALRRWGETGAVWADIFEEGGTLSAGDSSVLEEATRKSAGVVVYQTVNF